jgi:DNA-binding PadR family transcriptional regulator
MMAVGAVTPGGEVNLSIEYAILGLLSWKPFSGYDLKKIIAESDVYYWSGNNNQIYNRMVSLHKQGLVTQEVLPQSSGTVRRRLRQSAGKPARAGA